MPLSSEDGIVVLTGLHTQCADLNIEPVAFAWNARLGYSLTFDSRADAEAFLNAVGHYEPGHLFGDIQSPQETWTISYEGFAVRVYAPA